MIPDTADAVTPSSSKITTSSGMRLHSAEMASERLARQRSGRSALKRLHYCRQTAVESVYFFVLACVLCGSTEWPSLLSQTEAKEHRVTYRVRRLLCYHERSGAHKWSDSR